MADNKIQLEFKANIIIRGKIECVTGLHIGGSKDKLEIGGVDSPVVRHPGTKLPYIPGSSLKGKMRHLLELSLGAIGNKDDEGGVSDKPKIVRLFGFGAPNKEENDIRQGPSRLVFRDCEPDEDTQEMWDKLDSELLYTEYKAENTINRLTSAANPRFIERVVAGSFFNFEIIYSIFDWKDDKDEDIQEDLDNLRTAMRMLENNFLGKSGTRGYGQVRFHIAEPVLVKTEDYRSNSDKYKQAVAALKKEALKPLSQFNIN